MITLLKPDNRLEKLFACFEVNREVNVNAKHKTKTFVCSLARLLDGYGTSPREVLITDYFLVVIGKVNCHL